MTDKRDTLENNMEADGLIMALNDFKLWQANGYSETECMARAIMVYAMCGVAKSYQRLKTGLEHEEKPLDELYPKIEHRYVAVRERNRAVSILSTSFEELDWTGKVDFDEVALFLGVVQSEIEGV